jgi:hypothetical protein
MGNEILKGLDQNNNLRQVLLDQNGRVQTTYGDQSIISAFPRLRIADLESLFDNTFEYSENTTLVMTTETIGGGSLTFLPNISSVQLGVGTGAGDRAVIQSKDYIRYQPGKGQLIHMTGAFGVGQSGTIKRWGYYDDQNGIFWEQDDSVINIVLRSSSSGILVETRVPQSQWNVDPLDGTGPSGIVLNPTLSQILDIDLQWLGSGRVRVSFNINGQHAPAHNFLNANILSVPYMTTANLPIRWEIINNGPVAAPTSFIATCASVASEGRVDINRYYPFSAASGSSLTAVNGALVPVL